MGSIKAIKASAALCAALLALAGCARSSRDPGAALVKAVEAAMVEVGPGSFAMGRDGKEPDAGPARSVTIGYAFRMLRHEVTFEEYDAYCEAAGKPLPRDGGARGRMPVVNVSYADAARFCNFLSLAAGLAPCYDASGSECDLAAGGYRLPTEAEWEYAAAGGPGAPAGNGSATDWPGSSDPGPAAWLGNLGSPREVEGKAPNGLGLYDLAGNVWEWCNDWYLADYYGRAPVVDPPGPTRAEAAAGSDRYGPKRVRRGGNYHESAARATVWSRSCDKPGQADAGMGFRIVRRVP